MRFAAAQIPAKIGWRSLNGEKLDELHYVALIFGQFAVLHARSPRFLHAFICKAAVGRTRRVYRSAADGLHHGDDCRNARCASGRGC